MRQRLGDVLDQVEDEVEHPHERRGVPGPGAERLGDQGVDEATRALLVNGETDHEHPHRERERERGVHVGGRDDAKAVVRAQRAGEHRHPVHGQEIHRVHEDHPHEHRERQRRHELVRVAVEDPVHLTGDEVEADLDESLFPRRHSGSRAAREPPEEPQAHEAQQDRDDHRVDVDRHESVAAMGGESEVVRDVLAGTLVLGCHLDGSRQFFSSVSRTAMAAANTPTVIMKVVRKARCTTSLYVVSTSSNPAKIRRILSPSALNIVPSASPADRASPRDTRHPYTPPATIFTAPPRTAENAPSFPQRSPATSVSATVTMTCHRSTMRMGRGSGFETIWARKTKPPNYSVNRAASRRCPEARRGSNSRSPPSPFHLAPA